MKKKIFTVEISVKPLVIADMLKSRGVLCFHPEPTTVQTGQRPKHIENAD